MRLGRMILGKLFCDFSWQTFFSEKIEKRLNLVLTSLSVSWYIFWQMEELGLLGD